MVSFRGLQGRSARRHRRTVQPEQIVEAHDDFNLDLGNYAMTTFAHEFEMEYSGEHDVCDYTTMFLVDCEGYFKGDGSPLPLAAFHRTCTALLRTRDETDTVPSAHAYDWSRGKRRRDLLRIDGGQVESRRSV